MKLQVIGRDPAITMQITRLIGERAARKKKRDDLLAIALSPFSIVSKWIGGIR